MANKYLTADFVAQFTRNAWLAGANCADIADAIAEEAGSDRWDLLVYVSFGECDQRLNNRELLITGPEYERAFPARVRGEPK